MSRYLVSALAAACLLGAASSAAAESYETQISAYVPIRCEARFDSSFEGGDGTVMLGQVYEWCNTRFSLTLSHAPAPSGAAVICRGQTVTMMGRSTVLASTSGPYIGTDALMLAGVTEDEASQVAGAMTLSIAPLGL